MSEEIPTATGYIVISHHVDCPHCGETMYDDFDRDWWEESITDQMPSDEAYKEEYEVNCKECDKPFKITHWET